MPRVGDPKRDPKDDQVGLVGYEISFNHHFYEYQPPRDLAAIDAKFASLLKLGRAERLQLVEDLWDSLAQEGAVMT